MNLDDITTKRYILALIIRDDGERLLLGDGYYEFKDALQHFQPNGIYWKIIAYCTAVGGCLLSVGSTSGLALMKMEHVHLGWYLKNLTPKVLIGFVLGLLVLYMETYIF